MRSLRLKDLLGPVTRVKKKKKKKKKKNGGEMAGRVTGQRGAGLSHTKY